MAISRRRWRQQNNPPIRRSDPVFDLFEWAVPAGSLFMIGAGTGLSKRGMVPLDVSGVIVLVIAVALSVVLVAVIIRMATVSEVPRLSRIGAIALVCCSVLAPIILWLRNGAVLSPLIAVTMSVNVACVGLALVVIRLRSLSVAASGLGTIALGDASTDPSAESASTDPNAVRRVRIRKPRYAWGAIRQVPRMLAIAFFVTAALVFALLWANWIRLSAQPAYWGTYVEDTCDPRPKGGCDSVGTWMSDDGSIRLDEVELDGRVNADGKIRALYMPDEREPGDAIVHVESSVAIAPVLFPVSIIGTLGAAFHYGRQWWGWGRSRRHSAPGDATER